MTPGIYRCAQMHRRLFVVAGRIAAELGEAPAGGAHYEALFLLGVVLFFITMLINFSVEYISSRTNK